jgi:hypothetical protein
MQRLSEVRVHSAIPLKSWNTRLVAQYGQFGVDRERGQVRVRVLYLSVA